MHEQNALNVGDAAPEFALMDEHRQTVKLSEHRGKTIVLIFYPMDFSGVCDREHSTFAAHFRRIAPDENTMVFGVNCDHPFSHAAFKKQYNLPYTLLSDTSREMTRAYGMFSGIEPFNCAKRGTVVIDPEGTIAVYEPTHPGEERDVEDVVRYARAGRGRTV